MLRTSIGRPAFLTEVFCEFPQSLHKKEEIVPGLADNSLFPSISKFFTHPTEVTTAPNINHKNRLPAFKLVLWNSTPDGSNNNCSKQFTIQSRWLPLSKDISDTGCKLWSVGGGGAKGQSHDRWIVLVRVGLILRTLLTQT